jgi:hypothetical protein
MNGKMFLPSDCKLKHPQNTIKILERRLARCIIFLAKLEKLFRAVIVRFRVGLTLTNAGIPI